MKTFRFILPFFILIFLGHYSQASYTKLCKNIFKKGYISSVFKARDSKKLANLKEKIYKISNKEDDNKEVKAAITFYETLFNSEILLILNGKKAPTERDIENLSKLTKGLEQNQLDYKTRIWDKKRSKRELSNDDPKLIWFLIYDSFKYVEGYNASSHKLESTLSQKDLRLYVEYFSQLQYFFDKNITSDNKNLVNINHPEVISSYLYFSKFIVSLRNFRLELPYVYNSMDYNSDIRYQSMRISRIADEFNELSEQKKIELMKLVKNIYGDTLGEIIDQKSINYDYKNDEAKWEEYQTAVLSLYRDLNQFGLTSETIEVLVNQLTTENLNKIFALILNKKPQLNLRETLGLNDIMENKEVSALQLETVKDLRTILISQDGPRTRDLKTQIKREIRTFLNKGNLKTLIKIYNESNSVITKRHITYLLGFNELLKEEAFFKINLVRDPNTRSIAIHNKLLIIQQKIIAALKIKKNKNVILAHDLSIKDLSEDFFKQVDEVIDLLTARPIEVEKGLLHQLIFEDLNYLVTVQGPYQATQFDLLKHLQEKLERLSEALNYNLGFFQLKLNASTHEKENELETQKYVQMQIDYHGSNYDALVSIPYEELMSQMGKSEKPYLKESIETLERGQFVFMMKSPEAARWGIPVTGFLNQYLAGVSEGGYDPEKQNGKERLMSWMSQYPFEKYKELNPFVKPKYGFLGASQDSKLFNPNKYSVSSEDYGGDIWVFKKEAIKDRSFVVVGDSWENTSVKITARTINTEIIPMKKIGLIAPYLAKTLRHGSDLFANVGYLKDSDVPTYRHNGVVKEIPMRNAKGLFIELQIFGHITLDDIAQFKFTKTPPTGEFLRELEKHGIEIIDERDDRSTVQNQ